MEPDPILDTAEGRRLQAVERGEGWRRWGPYLSERQWGTVREDYSPGGTAWEYLPHDMARSRAYRWGEDGLAGFADDRLRWCLALALWNGHDPILKERLFGLTNAQGNHGEDVKELYYFLDGTPTHSYMRMLYKYPQAEYPYARLLAENARRGVADREFELVDTGIFAERRYFDVEVEYAKASTDDILMRITVHNRGPDAAPLHVLPHLWARNEWSWQPGTAKPQLRLDHGRVTAEHPGLARLRVCEVDAPEAEWLFCENETNFNRLSGTSLPGPFKDGINDFVVGGVSQAVNPLRRGTKCAAHMRYSIPAGGQVQLRLRFRPDDPEDAFAWFDPIMDSRRADADAFYDALQRGMAGDDARLVQRQALAGMLWCKQFYAMDVRRWLDGDPGQPSPPEQRKHGRDIDWRHLDNADVISMPDTWEYPWYAAWDLAFHTVTFAMIDPGFAKAQLLLLMRERFMHPNGQLPAYEWAFGDVNPPVHAWAVLRVFQMDRIVTGQPDRKFLEMAFHKLLLNFTWWVNRKDENGRNIFQGGFLGLDNIAIFDRSNPLPTGGSIDQSDGTAWMAMFTLNMMRIALELALEDDAYEDMATKFFEHFLYIAEAMTTAGGIGLWDEQDQFYYDVLHLPAGGETIPLRVRSIVGLIPLFAVEVIGSRAFVALPEFSERLQYFLNSRPDLAALISRWTEPGTGERHLLSLLRGHRVKMLLRRMLDEKEFLSPHGVRALSKAHEAEPYVLHVGGATFSIGYEPGEGSTHAFGGNSNWRGPVWMPINILLIDSLREFQRYYGDEFQVECPVGSGTMVSLQQVADMLSQRLTTLFLRGPDGRRAFLGDDALSQTDPEFRDHLLFHEYFHGDTGRGLGASHQTGWTGCIALLLAGPDSAWAKTTAQHPQAADGAAPPGKATAT